MQKFNDNVVIQNKIISKVIEGLFKLPTRDLYDLYVEIHKELISRKDYNNLQDLKQSYEIIKQELIDRGVYNV